MGHQSKVQVIRRGEKNSQYYLILPAPVAQALEMQKSETIEWVIEDKNTLIVRRISGSDKKGKR
jgi:antitoxin component of MazEF toxin-antitoxin module